MKYKFIVIILVTTINLVSAQENCITKFKVAENTYNEGKFDACISILEKSLNECVFSTIEKEDIYTLLIKSYIEIDNIDKIYQYMKLLLQNNPHYKVEKELVQPDFIKYCEKFKIRPIFYIGAKIGLIAPVIKTERIYSLLNTVDYSVPYNSKIGANFGVCGEYVINEVYNVCSDFSYSAFKYERNLIGETDGTNINYSEKISNVDFSLFFKGSIKKKDLLPYGFIGLNQSFLLKSKSNILMFDNIHSGGKVENIDMVPQRKKYGSGFICGIGCSYLIDSWKLSCELKFDVPFYDANWDDKRYENNNLILRYYVDNDYKIYKFIFGVGCTYAFKYNVKLKR